VNWQQTLNPYWQLEAGLAWGENDQITLSTDPSTNVTTDTSSLEHDWLPKLGLIYTPDNSTHVRLAGWKGMDSEAVGDASLAPATLAGFMLNRTSDNYKLVRGVALGADKQLGAAWFLEGRVQRRWTDSPLNNGFATRFIPRLTDESRLALHWQPENQPLNFTLAYDDELFQLGDLRSFETNSVQEQHLRATQLDFRWFVNSQLTANFGLSHNQLDAIQQQTLCDLLAVSCSGIIVPFDVSQSFNNADASVSWKLNQHGSVDAGVRNAANTGILYTELDPLIPRFSQGRQVYAKVKLTW
jgi:outer membrane receptor protein involved in Fe transport